MTKKMRAGRLALRLEEQWWVAYYARPDTMEGAEKLGMIHIRFVEDVTRRNIFIALMQEAVSDLIEEILGERPDWPDPPQYAPESERKEPTP